MPISDTNEISNLECDYNVDSVGALDDDGFTFNWNESHGNGDIITTPKPWFVLGNPLDSAKKMIWWPGFRSTNNPVVPRLGPLCQSAFTAMAVVVIIPNGVTLAYAFGPGNSGDANPFALFGLNSTGPTYFASIRGNGGSGTVSLNSSFNADSRLVLATIIWTGTSFQAWVNSQSMSSGAHSAAKTFNQFKLACSPRTTDVNPSSVGYCRFVFWSKALDATERTDAWDLLNSDHSLTTPITGELTIPSHLHISGRPLSSRFYWNASVQQWEATLDLSHSVPTPSHYIDPVGGSDSNPGTSGSKYKTVSKGLEQATLLHALLDDGLYPGTSWNNTFTRPQRSFALTAPTLAIISNSEDSMGNGWALQTGTTWKTARTAATVMVVDVTNRNSDNKPVKLTSVASIAACDALPNSYHNDGSGFVYVNTWDGRQPDYKVVIVIGTVTLRYPYSDPNHTGFLKNLIFINPSTGQAAGDAAYDFANCAYVFENVEMLFGTEHSFSLAHAVIRKDYQHHGSISDACDFRGSVHGLHVNVVISDTGAGDSDNGETCHATSTLVSCNTSVKDSNRPFHHIDTTQVVHLSPTVDRATTTGGADTGVAFQSGLTGTVHTNEVSVYNPRVSNVDTAEVVTHSQSKMNFYGVIPQNFRITHNGSSQPVFPERRRLMFPGYGNALLMQTGIPIARNN